MIKYFKPGVFFLSTIPFLFIFYKIYFNKLGPEPVKEITHFTGEWTLIFICLTLSMTPLKRLTNLTMWVSFRRMLGLFVFFFNWQLILDDVFKKKYIFIGFAAWVLLIPLAITSSQKMIKLLKNNWKRLHRLIYMIAIFGSLHYIWLSKTIFFKPLVYLVIILVLLALRIKIKKRNVNYG